MFESKDKKLMVFFSFLNFIEFTSNLLIFLYVQFELAIFILKLEELFL